MGNVFLKLLNMSISASWLILAVLCVRLLFRKMPKWLNCVLWGIVAVRLVIPFSIESEFSLQPSAEPIKTSAVVEGEVLPYVPSLDSNLTLVEDTLNPMLAETFAYQASESAAPLQVFTGIAGGVWLCGMIVLLLWAMGSLIRLCLMVREAVPYGDEVYICDAVQSPFILGIIRPRIYLSSALSEEKTAYVMAHEKAHLGRKDHLWKPLGYLILCVYWFNPLCWVAYICLCKDIELACDEKVIRKMSFAEKKDYSRALLSCAAQRRLVSVCPLAFGEVSVKERVKSVLRYKKPAFWVTAAAIAVCAIIAVCFLTNPSEEYQATETIPQEDAVTIENSDGLGDTEVYEELINAEKRDVTHDGVEDYIVTSMTYYPDNVDREAALQERIAQHIMYDGVCVKVYDGQDGSGEYSEEYLLWSQYYSRVHVGNGQLNIVQIDGKDYLLTSSLWGGQGVASWDFELFSLNEGGEKEVIDKQSVGFEIGTEASVVSKITFQDSLNQYIDEGILIVACDIDFEEQLVRTQEDPFVPKDYYSHAFSKYDEEYEAVEMQGTDAGTTMVDVSAISSIVVTNGNTGEQKILTAADDYYSFYDLTKLYRQLDFSAEYEENTRVGYQYNMKLLDAGGNTLQSVTPYKDGLTVDRIFFKYDNTGNAAAVSLRLMEYLEYVTTSEESMVFEENWGITLSAEDITPTSATMKCTQSGGEPTGILQTGSWFILESWTQEQGWKEMPYAAEGDVAWTMEAWAIPLNDTCEWEVNWEWLYGELPNGKYRIGKEFTDFRAPGDFDNAAYFAEFEITE